MRVVWREKSRHKYERERQRAGLPYKPQKLTRFEEPINEQAPVRRVRGNVHVSMDRLRTASAQEILTHAADWVESQAWAEYTKPDLFSCLVSSLGTSYDDRLTSISGEGWHRRRHQGVYLPRASAEQYVQLVTGQRPVRNKLTEVLDLIVAAVGYEDLGTWSVEYSTGPADVADAFRKASGLSGSVSMPVHGIA
jgi:hypothetical protein